MDIAKEMETEGFNYESVKANLMHLLRYSVFIEHRDENKPKDGYPEYDEEELFTSYMASMCKPFVDDLANKRLVFPKDEVLFHTCKAKGEEDAKIKRRLAVHEKAWKELVQSSKEWLYWSDYYVFQAVHLLPNIVEAIFKTTLVANTDAKILWIHYIRPSILQDTVVSRETVKLLAQLLNAVVEGIAKSIEKSNEEAVPVTKSVTQLAVDEMVRQLVIDSPSLEDMQPFIDITTQTVHYMHKWLSRHTSG